jgi:hypothetical protein
VNRSATCTSSESKLPVKVPSPLAAVNATSDALPSHAAARSGCSEL